MALIGYEVHAMLDLLGSGRQDVFLLCVGRTFSSIECACLALALAHNESMQSLTVSDFPEEVWVVIAEALKHNVKLKSVSFAGDHHAGMALAHVLKHNGTLDSATFSL